MYRGVSVMKLLFAFTTLAVVGCSDTKFSDGRTSEANSQPESKSTELVEIDLAASTAVTKTITWRFSGNLAFHSSSNLKTADFIAGTRQGFEGVNRYFNVQFKELSGSASADLYVQVRTSIPANWPTWYLRTAWYEGKNVGYPYNSVNWGHLTGGSQDSVRRTTLHEITHFFGLDLHSRQTELTGNRVVDIGGTNATWTDKDVAFLATKSVVLKSGVVKPKDDFWWWTKAAAPVATADSFKFTTKTKQTLDVLKNDKDANNEKITIVSVKASNGGLVSTDGAFVYYQSTLLDSGTETLTYYIQDQTKTGGLIAGTVTVQMTLPVRVIYPWTNPKNKFDVNNDGRVSALDALVIINALNRTIVLDKYVKPDNFYDVNGDNVVTSLDALQVINELNRM